MEEDKKLLTPLRVAKKGLKRSGGTLLWSYDRNDQEQLRLYKNTHLGRPYIEISTWKKTPEGWVLVRLFCLRRYDVRPLLAGLAVALDTLGVTLRPEEKEVLELQEVNQ